MNKFYRLYLVLFILIGTAGCSSFAPLRELFSTEGSKGGEKGNLETKTRDDQVRFSENPNIGAFNERRYRRVTRKSLEEESEVGSRAGSLWNTEAPSSYLFSQNKLHREGDLLSVKVEGNAKGQVDAKIQVIKKLLARLDIVPTQVDGPSSAPAPVPVGSNRDPAAATVNPPAEDSASNSGAGGNGATSLPSTKPTASTNAVKANVEDEGPINIEAIPTRVTERMSDGNYRVKGSQSFMIGKKEFRVIMTGLVRPEDFSDEGISSNKLLDPQVDVVSLRRSMQ